MSAKSPPAAIDVSVLKPSLSPLAPILDAFNHRHKNAHHSSHWWSHFNILRRAVKKILDLPSRQDALLPRLRWLRDVFVPKAYVPFTQLVADPQHAPLGLLLMGVLARINTILIHQLGDEATTTSVSTFERRDTKTDKGVAISRDDFTKPQVVQAPEAYADTGLVGSRSDHAKPSVPKSSKTTSKTTEADEFAHIFADEDKEGQSASSAKLKEKKAKSTIDSETAAPPKKKRKKTKARGGDAFSSIFDSL